MADPLTSDQLLEAIANLKATPPLRRFRLLCDLAREIQDAIDIVSLEMRERERQSRETDNDIAFLKHHRAKLDICYRALRGTYAAPDRAMAALNALCKKSAPEAVLAEISTGSQCLGKAEGWRLVGIASGARKQADENYFTVVVPVLSKIIPDQAGYLDIIARDLEMEVAKAQNALAVLSSEKQALEAAQHQFEREILAAAIEMTPEDLRQLQPHQDEYRAAVALIEQHDSATAPDEE